MGQLGRIAVRENGADPSSQAPSYGPSILLPLLANVREIMTSLSQARSAFSGNGSATRRPPFRRLLIVLSGLVSLVAVAPLGAESGIPRSDSPEGARVYFISPQAGQTVSSPVTVRFGLSQMGVAPAGVSKDATGHHHLILDAELPPVALPIPATDHYRHFGLGQTEVDLELTTGEHTLQLLVGDHNHIPHDPPVVSERITITVR